MFSNILRHRLKDEAWKVAGAWNGEEYELPQFVAEGKGIDHPLFTWFLPDDLQGM